LADEELSPAQITALVSTLELVQLSVAQSKALIMVRGFVVGSQSKHLIHMVRLLTFACQFLHPEPRNQNFEYVLGTIMGMYAVKLLLPAALGLIAGLITGFNNLKHLLPQSSMLGNMAVICAAIVMPLFAAFLATTFQVLGDERCAPCTSSPPVQLLARPYLFISLLLEFDHQVPRAWHPIFVHGGWRAAPLPQEPDGPHSDLKRH
jgi:hypothetical protein